MKLLGCTLLGTHTRDSSFYEAAYGVDGAQLTELLEADAMRFGPSDSSLEAVAARASRISYAEWKQADTRRHELRRVWHEFLESSASGGGGGGGGYDVLICPAFATAAFAHDHSGSDIQPFWRETGRKLTVDGTETAYERHVFWSALTGTCFLPSTVFPTGCGDDSGLPIGLQVVGQEGADYICIDFVRLLEEECGFTFRPPPLDSGTGAPRGCVARL